MSHDISISSQTKAEIYKELLPQITQLVADENDLTANMANMAAALKTAFGFLWVGFYMAKAGQLVLGPFQGPVACTRIAFTKGVCGASFSSGNTVIVPDVAQFPGHIACSSASKSEIVIPIFENNTVVGVLDVDSDQLSDFDKTDQHYLEQICTLLFEK